MQECSWKAHPAEVLSLVPPPEGLQGFSQVCWCRPKGRPQQATRPGDSRGGEPEGEQDVTGHGERGPGLEFTTPNPALLPSSTVVWGHHAGPGSQRHFWRDPGQTISKHRCGLSPLGRLWEAQGGSWRRRSRSEDGPPGGYREQSRAVSCGWKSSGALSNPGANQPKQEVLLQVSAPARTQGGAIPGWRGAHLNDTTHHCWAPVPPTNISLPFLEIRVLFIQIQTQPRSSSKPTEKLNGILKG